MAKNIKNYLDEDFSESSVVKSEKVKHMGRTDENKKLKKNKIRDERRKKNSRYGM